MRSRYSAYVKRDYGHLERSLGAAERKDFNLERTRQWAESSDWLGLTVLHTEAGREEDAEGLVEFSARFRNSGHEHNHVETARFAREEGRWVYAGQVEKAPQPIRREAPKVGRNDPCPCGSGRKYKKCCGTEA